MMTKDAYVYILTNKKHGVLYTGVTNDLQRRMYEHKHQLVSGFSSKYNTSILVWFLHGESIIAANLRSMTNRGRQWKINLIERSNPTWQDLSKTVMLLLQKPSCCAKSQHLMQGKTRHAAPTKTVMLREVAASGHKIKGNDHDDKRCICVHINKQKAWSFIYRGD